MSAGARGACLLLAGAAGAILLTLLVPLALNELGWALLVLPAPMAALALLAPLRTDSRLREGFRIAIAVHAGAVLAFLLLFLTDSIQPSPKSIDLLLTTFLAFLALGLDVAVLVFNRVATERRETRWPNRWAVPLSALGFLAVALAWSLANIVVVDQQARTTAAGRPYCLQVSGHSWPLIYVPVTSPWQLSGFSMQAPVYGGGTGDYQFTFHAVLLVKDLDATKRYNWSYVRQDFQPVTNLGLALGRPDCVPKDE